MTREERMPMVAEVDALRNQGMSVDLACKKVGIKPPTYLYYKAGRTKSGKKIKQDEIKFTTIEPAPKTYTKKEAKLALIIGSAKEIKGFLNEYI